MWGYVTSPADKRNTVLYSLRILTMEKYSAFRVCLSLTVSHLHLNLTFGFKDPGTGIQVGVLKTILVDRRLTLLSLSSPPSHP